MELGQQVGQGVGLGDLLGTARDVELNPVAGRQDHELVAGEGLRQEVEPGGVLGPVEGQRLADRGRRGPVVDPQSQQSHGVLILSTVVVLGAPWAVGSRSASTPTQVKTKKPKATIVSTITLSAPHRRPEPRVEQDREDQPHQTAR